MSNSLHEDITKAELCEKLIKEGVTGQLYNVNFVDKNFQDPRYPNIGGRIIVDTRNRFWAGDVVYTSTLERIYTNDEGRTFAKTRYSLYELIDFNPTEIPEDYKYAFETI